MRLEEEQSPCNQTAGEWCCRILPTHLYAPCSVSVLTRSLAFAPLRRFQSRDKTADPVFYHGGAGQQSGYYRRGPYDPNSPALARTHFEMNTAEVGSVFYLDSQSGPWQYRNPVNWDGTPEFLAREITITHQCVSPTPGERSASIVVATLSGGIRKQYPDQYKIVTVGGECECKSWSSEPEDSVHHLACKYPALAKDFKVREAQDTLFFQLNKGSTGFDNITREVALRFWVTGLLNPNLTLPGYRVVDRDAWPSWLSPVSMDGTASRDGLDNPQTVQEKRLVTALLHKSESKWPWDAFVELTASPGGLAEGDYQATVWVQPVTPWQSVQRMSIKCAPRPHLSACRNT